jgi:hypothetical protein
MKLTQTKWVAQQLRANGSITRNECLREYISRLASIINRLENDGWIIRGEYVPVITKFGKGKDYKYTAFNIPAEV